MDEPLTILVPARDEEHVIGKTVATLRRTFPDAEVIVADDGSRDGTADAAEAAGAIVLRLPRRGKGQALSAAERAAPPGALLLCDADLSGELAPLLDGGGDLNVAAFAKREGGGFGLAKRLARALIEVLAGFEAREPLVRPAGTLSGGAPRLLPGRRRLRLRSPHDDRRRTVAPVGARSRAAADGIARPGGTCAASSTGGSSSATRSTPAARSA